MDGQQKLIQECKDVLSLNDLGHATRPAAYLYPHQWLWDSCFIAIGIRHYDVKRAQREIKSLFKGQWKNGMLPNMILGESDYYANRIWRSSVSPNSPRKVKTSGITQPPMVAEAVVRIGEKLKASERKQWYRSVFDDLVRYHEWLYRERDPRNQGLVVLVHPWECGLDNNPAWMKEMHLNEMPLWIKLIKRLKIYRPFEMLRRDTKHLFLPAYERVDTIDALGMFSIARRLRRKKYDSSMILRHAHLSIEDLAFNSILVRANTHLAEIASYIDRRLPGWLWERMKKTPHSLELLWDEAEQQYFSRSYDVFELIKEPSIMAFLPLYAGTISKSRAAHLVELLKSRDYKLKYPVPSVARSSKYFTDHRYWQGPTWINTNWLIIDGLKRYGYHQEAVEIANKSIELMTKSGSREYFSPLNGRGLGASNFSWTAALVLDLLYQ